MHHLFQLGSGFLWVSCLLAQSAVVPGGFVSFDAAGVGAIPGFSQRFRQQIVYGDGLLNGLRGQALSEIRFRRDGQFLGALVGGRAQVDMVLSTTTRPVLETGPMFASNHGAPVSVFSGFVNLPTSPSLGSPHQPTWVAPYAVAIPLTTTFPYAAGQLVVDISGTPDASNRSPWWPVDHYTEVVSGTVTLVGTACDSQNDLFVAKEQLIPGSSARFVAGGHPSGNNILALAAQRRPPVDLGFLGFPGCTLHLTPEVMLTRPLSLGTNGSAGSANHVLQLPLQPQLLGFGLAAQCISVWIDQPSQALRLTTSPALDLTFATRLPILDAAVVTSTLLSPSDPWPSIGRVSVVRVPVTRFAW